MIMSHYKAQTSRNNQHNNLLDTKKTTLNIKKNDYDVTNNLKKFNESNIEYNKLNTI